MTQTRLFARREDGDWHATPEGNRRRVILHTDELMMVEFVFDAGGEGWLHSHPHVQASYVAEGSFEVTIGDSTETLSAGDSYIVPANLVHGVRALEGGRLIDSFTPARADFLA